MRRRGTFLRGSEKRFLDRWCWTGMVPQAGFSYRNSLGDLVLKLPGLQAHVPTVSRILENHFNTQ